MTTTAQFPTTVQRSHFDGQVRTPGTRGYDSARSVWNGMIDHRPKLIVYDPDNPFHLNHNIAPTRH